MKCEPTVTLAVCCALALSGCSTLDDAPVPAEDGTPTASASAPDSAPVPEQAPALGADLPVDTRPVGQRTNFTECPYLDTQWVADTNGQRVTGVDVDTRFDPPACVYFSYPEAPQLEVIVRHMPTEAEAIAVVGTAAPISTTEPADQPAGWMGGRAGEGMVPGVESSVYAVQKGQTAVVVYSNQGQSFKPEQVAGQVINNLGL